MRLIHDPAIRMPYETTPGPWCVTDGERSGSDLVSVVTARLGPLEDPSRLVGV
jgi:hypothetical protein